LFWQFRLPVGRRLVFELVPGVQATRSAAFGGPSGGRLSVTNCHLRRSGVLQATISLQDATRSIALPLATAEGRLPQAAQRRWFPRRTRRRRRQPFLDGASRGRSEEPFLRFPASRRQSARFHPNPAAAICHFVQLHRLAVFAAHHIITSRFALRISIAWGGFFL